MAVSFELEFDYDIKYKPSDTLYFGINLILGCREFPIRRNGSPAPTPAPTPTPAPAPALFTGEDFTPRSSSTFNFTAVGLRSLSVTDDSILDSDGKDDIKGAMLYTNPSDPSAETFKTGSVALRQIVEFNQSGGGSLSDFFNSQYTQISSVSLKVKIDDVTTTLVGKPSSVKLGKQYGEILLLSWENAA